MSGGTSQSDDVKCVQGPFSITDALLDPKKSGCSATPPDSPSWLMGEAGGSWRILPPEWPANKSRKGQNYVDSSTAVWGGTYDPNSFVSMWCSTCLEPLYLDSNATNASAVEISPGQINAGPNHSYVGASIVFANSKIYFNQNRQNVGGVDCLHWRTFPANETVVFYGNKFYNEMTRDGQECQLPDLSAYDYSNAILKFQRDSSYEWDQINGSSSSDVQVQNATSETRRRRGRRRRRRLL